MTNRQAARVEALNDRNPEPSYLYAERARWAKVLGTAPKVAPRRPAPRRGFFARLLGL